MDGGVTNARLDPVAVGRQQLRVLLSAYACEPHKGSEPGIGWHWASALARAGHEVWVLTRTNNRNAIESALGQKPIANLHFAYYDLPGWARWWKRGGYGVRFYYMLWQLGAYRVARRLCGDVRFDVAHHITFGVFRHPSFLAFLGVPFVFGPVGGGEAVPRELRRTLPPRAYLRNLMRDIANRAVRVDPLMAAVYRRSAVTLCKTNETLRCIPARYRDKCLVRVELGTEKDGPARLRRRPEENFRVLYVGRLVYWKGLHLGLMAFAKFRETHPRAKLTIVGSGPSEDSLHRLAQRLDIIDAVNWVSWIDRAAVTPYYLRHDAFLFPSLHDSSGNAVLEALSCGLPVVCLEAGGPAVLVDSSCGFRVRPDGPQQAVKEMAKALAALADNAALAQAMRNAAVRRAREHFSWERQVSRMERLYLDVCASPGGVAQGSERCAQ